MTREEIELIDTLWNVNEIYIGITSYMAAARINRYIMECK